MLFYTAWDVAELVFVWLVYVETKGPATLEEVARLFDGEDASVAHVVVAKGAIHHAGDYYNNEGLTRPSVSMPRRGSAARRYYSEKRW